MSLRTATINRLLVAFFRRVHLKINQESKIKHVVSAKIIIKWFALWFTPLTLLQEKKSYIKEKGMKPLDSELTNNIR